MASFGVSPLDAERRRLERRRALVDILQKQAMAGPEAPTMPGAQMSPYQGLAKMGEALIAALANRAQEKREKAFAGEEQKQALKTGEDIAGMLIAQSPDLGKPIDVNTPLPQTQATPMYAPQEQISLPVTNEQITTPSALSAKDSEFMASLTPGIPDLRSSFAAQQARVAREKPQLDAARNALAKTIAGGGAPAQFAISNQQAMNQRAFDVGERKRQEQVQAEQEALRAGEQRSQFSQEMSQRESANAAQIANAQAQLSQNAEQFAQSSIQKSNENKQQRALEMSRIIAASANNREDRKLQLKLAELERQQRSSEANLNRQNAFDIANIRASNAKKDAKEQAEVLASQSAIDLAQQQISQIDSLLQHPGLSTVGTLTGEYLTSKIPGTDATDFRNQLNQVIGGARLRGVQMIKGTGAVSDAEGKAVASALNSMNSATSKEQFEKDAADYRELLTKIVEKNQKRFSGNDPLGLGIN